VVKDVEQFTAKPETNLFRKSKLPLNRHIRLPGSEALMRYRGGTANYLDVLDSQRSLFQSELTLAQARNNEYQGLVQLYKALGGGWK